MCSSDLKLLARLLEGLGAACFSLAELPPDERIRSVHTLRGVAGNLGARRLHKAASHLEYALRSDAALAAWPDEVASFEAAVRETDAAVRAYLPPLTEGDDGSAPSSAPPGPAEIDAVRAALRSGDLSATELVGREPAAWRALLREQHGPFVAAVEGFDFDRALALLDAA